MIFDARDRRGFFQRFLDVYYVLVSVFYLKSIYRSSGMNGKLVLIALHYFYDLIMVFSVIYVEKKPDFLKFDRVFLFEIILFYQKYLIIS